MGVAQRLHFVLFKFFKDICVLLVLKAVKVLHSCQDGCCDDENCGRDQAYFDRPAHSSGTRSKPRWCHGSARGDGGTRRESDESRGGGVDEAYCSVLLREVRELLVEEPIAAGGLKLSLECSLR